MANHKSAEKRHRQSLTRRTRNRIVKGAVRTTIKKVRASIDAKEGDVNDLLRSAESAIAKAASKGILNRKTARRQISRLAKASKKK
jgi:small subunit ribosomal protein S20